MYTLPKAGPSTIVHAAALLAVGAFVLAKAVLKFAKTSR